MGKIRPTHYILGAAALLLILSARKTRTAPLSIIRQLAEHSETATREAINNTLPPALISNAVEVYKAIYKPIADKFTVNLSSWYRSEELNNRINGANNSDHLSARALDFTTNDNRAALAYMVQGIPFKKLIVYGPKDNPRRFHISTGQGARTVLYKT